MTIVPHGVIVSQSGAISCLLVFFFFFFFFLKDVRLVELERLTCCRHRIALISHGFRVIGSNIVFF